MKTLMTAVIALAAMTGPALAQESYGDQSAVRDVVAGLEQAWADNDAAKFAGYFAENGEMVAPRGLRIIGRDAIEEGHAGVFQTIYAGTTMNLDVDRLRFMGSDTALVAAKQMIQAAPGTENQGSAGQDLLATMILQRTQDGWEIQYMDTVPAAPEDFALPTADNPSPNGE